MKELEDRPEVDELVLDDEAAWDEDPFTPTKILGVALAGALGSLLLYYLYVQMDPDKREKLKEGVMSAVRSQMRRLGEESEM